MISLSALMVRRYVPESPNRAAPILVAALAFAEFHDEPWQVALSTALFGVGLGLAYASMTSLIVPSVPREQTGVATGMNANIRTIGGSIGTALASSIITGHLQPNGLPAESGFTDTFLLLSASPPPR